MWASPSISGHGPGAFELPRTAIAGSHGLLARLVLLIWLNYRSIEIRRVSGCSGAESKCPANPDNWFPYRCSKRSVPEGYAYGRTGSKTEQLVDNRCHVQTPFSVGVHHLSKGGVRSFYANNWGRCPSKSAQSRRVRLSGWFSNSCGSRTLDLEALFCGYCRLFRRQMAKISASLVSNERRSNHVGRYSLLRQQRPVRVRDTDGSGQFGYGDFTGLDYYGGTLHFGWADNSNSTGDNPDTRAGGGANF